MHFRYVFLIILSLFLAACGRKGPLVPPEAFLPAPIATLKVEQKEERFFVSWSPPAADAGGKPLKELAGFRLFRREVLPPGEDCEECPTAYRLVRDVDLEYPKDVSRYDNIYVLVDTGLENGKTYQYKIVSYKKDGSESAPSNKARRKKVSTPAPPRLKALSTPTGVQLQWEPGDTTGRPAPAGYNVYRRRAGDVRSTRLLTPTPVKELRFEDLQLGQGVTYVYTVRGLAAVEGEAVEGGASNEAEGTLSQSE